jgi:hypothetical protein
MLHFDDVHLSYTKCVLLGCVWLCSDCVRVRVAEGEGALRMRCCVMPREGLVAARSSFANNTAALTGRV